MTQFDQRYQHVETQYNADQITIQQQPLSLTDKQRKQNRIRMLDRVQAIWIKGVLEPSVQGAAQIALELEHKPGAVLTPLWQEVRAFDTTRRLSSVDNSIVQVYDQANGEVLILGEPGAGKTTLLLELTRDLLKRAKEEETHPIPVVFSLSSWARSRPLLTEWLASELHTRYQVPLPLATSWIETDQVLPLLDGLDEVAAPQRAVCVEAINTYRQAHGLLPTVVCSRQNDYLGLSTRLLLRTAVIVQPLTPHQREAYLESAGAQAAALRTVLRQDADLHELATTPLMLTILLVASRGTSVDTISELTSLGAKRAQLFASYVQQMLKRRRAETRYIPEQTIRWLSHLAGQMRRQSQTIFYLEQMQPDWLSDSRMLGRYDWVAVRLPGIFMGILVGLIVNAFYSAGLSYVAFTPPSILLCGFLGGYLSEGSIPQRSGRSDRKVRNPLLQKLLIGALVGLGVGLSAGLRDGLRGGLSIGLLSGLLSGLFYGLCSTLIQFLLWKNNAPEAARFLKPSPVKRTAWQHLIRRDEIHNGLLVGLLVGLIFGLIWGLFQGLFYGLFYGLSYGLNSGLSAGILSVLLLGRSTAVQPTDWLVWSWRSLGKSLFSKSHASTAMQVTALIGLFVGLSNGLSVGLSVGLRDGLSVGLRDGLDFGLSVGLSYWLLLGLFEGVSSATIEDQSRVAPNQGIHRSALNGLVLALISTVIVGLLSRLSFALGESITVIVGKLNQFILGQDLGMTDVSYELPVVLRIGLSAGLLAGLLMGGLASLRHCTLRLLLWQTRIIPWNYPRFLDYAAQQILLRKVGGGYIFLHRLLLDYFADLETEPGSEKTGERKPEGAEPETMPFVSVKPMRGDEPTDVLTVPLAPAPLFSDIPRLLPCGHELSVPHARFCRVCGAPVPS